jgi:hypothetical protein
VFEELSNEFDMESMMQISVENLHNYFVTTFFLGWQDALLQPFACNRYPEHASMTAWPPVPTTCEGRSPRPRWS